MSLNHPENTVRHDTGEAGAERVRLFHAATDLESATFAARDARTRLQRATAARLYWSERHADAVARWKEEEPGTASAETQWLRVDFARWGHEDAQRNVNAKLDDYRTALGRMEAAGRIAGEADQHEVPSGIRSRARKAIAVADAFGNKVAMDATLYDGLKRPAFPELEPEVDVIELHAKQEGEPLRTKIVDPLEPIPAPRAVLVPLEDYVAPDEEEGSLDEAQREHKEKVAQDWENYRPDEA